MLKTAVHVLMLLVTIPVVLGRLCQVEDAVCKMSSGSYGCCPAPNGVCCADGDHCCPNEFKCDLSAKQCLRDGAGTFEMIKITPIGAKVTLPAVLPASHFIPTIPPRDDEKSSDQLTCPDGTACTSNTTCCLGLSNKFECCSLALGNCCSDYYHCCASGYVCDLANTPTLCIPASGSADSMPFLKKSP